MFVSLCDSVTQSTFASPCVSSGIDSGFQATPANASEFATWSFTVNNASAPLWFFCAQTVPANHCNAGMVFAVNPTQEKSFDAYQAIAKGQNGTAGASGAAASGAAATGGAAGGAAGGATPTAGATGSSATDSTGAASSSGSASPQGAINGAMHLSTNAVSLFTLAGLVAGLVL
ncbi:hypothetical protein K435DRAFT_784444 [Dendrothele bispora CBS 962.96]|uniref:Cupredoxin n=1 Tax=Dendrothele bispora (strain CBS 962.96) TaxID=1314807 RepID=A0A4S8L3D4_DENBC|nr:hypothetical protein K435DRAFT_784444 [Dendrothele bispora CBS 962.96]